MGIAVSIIAALAIAGVVVFFFLKNKKKSSDEAVVINQPSEPVSQTSAPSVDDTSAKQEQPKEEPKEEVKEEQKPVE